MPFPSIDFATLRAALPPEGLFAEKEWLGSPKPYPLTAGQISELEKIGYRLWKFQRACNLLYQLSVKGKQPAWIARLLDMGKPPELIELSRAGRFREDLPKVIRPDLIVTETGYALTELDSVPGGIGLTAWLNETYAHQGFDVVGSSRGMLEGFASIFPKGSIMISPESATYEPEMRWLVRKLEELHEDAGRWSVASTETLDVPENIYRFFELFDLPNLPVAKPLLAALSRGHTQMTPPVKPLFEEKMWLALFWMRPLQEFWRRELGEKHWLKLREIIPYGWVVNPEPVPPHAVLPGLEIQSWDELGDFSQKERELVLKISGFSELAWGSRGVVIGQDESQISWRDAVSHAVRSFDSHPYVLQRFHKGHLVQHPYFAGGDVLQMRGRVRLCPYYFATGKEVRLGGVLATICPADKKLLHGMRDAIIVPSAFA